MKISIINGPNLNLLGIREVDIYGSMPFEIFLDILKKKYPEVEFNYFQSNIEEEIVNELQRVGFDHHGIIFNPAGYTGTSAVIGNTVACIDTPVIEVHISNVNAREEFRRFSYVAANAAGRIVGLKLSGYELALKWFINNNAPPL